MSVWDDSPVRSDKLLGNRLFGNICTYAVCAGLCVMCVAVGEAAQCPEVYKVVPVPCSPHDG